MRSTNRATSMELIVAPVAGSMRRVDSKLAGISVPERGSNLGAVLQFSLAHTGKRLRPALVLLTAGAYGRSDDDVISVAAATECLHSATLIHDDIVDGASSRRGKPAAHVRWSHAAAVLGGDFLFGVAADFVASLGRPLMVRMFADTIMQMCRSEFGGPEFEVSPDAMREAYMQKIRGKTASLIALCCESAGELAGANEANKRWLKEFGLNLGMAFQIADDVLDVKGDETATGKPVGNDLRQGLLTLPAIHYLDMHPTDGSAVRKVIDQVDPSQEHVEAALVELARSGAVERAMEDAHSFARVARRCLRDMPAGPCTSALQDLTHYVVSRLS